MPPDVEIEEIQAEIAEQQSKMERDTEDVQPPTDIRDQMREILARDSWRRSRLCAD